MNSRYGYAVDAEVLDFFGELPRKHREQLKGILQLLADDPFQRGEHQRVRPSEQVLEVRAFFGRWVIAWWVDHPVCLVRVVEVRRLRLLS